jgi:predicted SAM-dependent methyltransferase
MLKINLGCGPVQPEGWLNVDGSHRAWLASKLPWIDKALVVARIIRATEFSTKTHFANLKSRLPWPDGTADAIYLGEVLEHFTRADGDKLVHECYRVLRSGGWLRVRVPDNVAFWQRYLDEYRQAFALPRQTWTLYHSRFIEMFFGDICVERPTLWQSMGHFHKWMYDEVSLILLFESAGFRDVSRKDFHTSNIPDINHVETRTDLIVEGRKP